jgi:peptidyl-prolyl cis-trans isomerase C
MITVNNITISEDAVLKEMQYHPAASQPQAMRKAAEGLIIAELLRQRACHLDLLDPEREGLEDRIDDLIQAEVRVPLAGEHECRLYYQNNPDRFMSSPLVEARHILLLAAPDDEQARMQSLEVAKALIQQLSENPTRFGSLAQQHSRCESAKAGGNLGQLSRGQTVVEFERQVFNAKPGLMRHPVETRYGVHVVQVDRNEAGRRLPFELVRERIENYLNEKVRRKAVAHYLQHLVAEADIRGYDFGISPSPLMQ